MHTLCAPQVNVQTNMQTLQRFRITVVPSVYFVRHREVVEYSDGALSVDAVRCLINREPAATCCTSPRGCILVKILESSCLRRPRLLCASHFILFRLKV
jgi:hypothetical protein